ncbi:P-loop containing nucleoside triphosphate hydrolase protein [Ramicandelaber brevisporus]|nr:P-loop containing nucleoside triphosphate hydrolase protein [Ramicandelaber brevisporus]
MNGDDNDNDDDDEEDAREFDALISRAPSQHSTQTISEAEMGVIESIELIDFMCHRHLKVEFGPRINFVIGRNGSGKSAILTALIICLGGRTSFTNRATRLSSFVREGASRAIIKVCIRNKGRDAFQPAVFGETIIVERIIEGSQYKIRNSGNKIISNKREALSAICDHMAIQVDNPLTVLNQDTARQFLSSTDPHEKYKFFLRGTQLTQLKTDLDSVMVNVDKHERSLDRREESVRDLMEEARKWELKYVDMEKARGLQVEIENIDKLIVWRLVIDEENKLEDLIKKSEKASQKIPSILHHIEQCNSKTNELDSNVSAAENEINRISTERQPTLDEINRLGQEKHIYESAIYQYDLTSEQINQEIRLKRESLAEVQLAIEREKERFLTEDSGKRARIERGILDLNEKVEKCNLTINSIETSVGELSNKLMLTEDAMNDLHGKRRQLQNEVSSLENKMKLLDRQKVDRMSAYGNGVAQVVNMIGSYRRWSGSAPIGPLGRYIRLKNLRWSKVFETVLNPALNAFVVERYEDRDILDQMMRKAGCKSNIYVTAMELFDYSQGEPSVNINTMLRVLDFENEFVKRILINTFKIEASALVEQRRDADDFMKNQPYNVERCYTMDGFRVTQNEGKLTTTALPGITYQPRLTHSVDSEMAETRNEIEQNKVSLNKLTKQIEFQNQDKRGVEMKMRELNNEIRKERSIKDGLEAEIERIKQTLRSADQPVGLQVYEDEKKEIESQIETILAQFTDLVAKKHQDNQTLQDIINQINNLSMKISGHADLLNVAELNLKNARINLAQNTSDLTHWNDMLGREQERVNIAQSETDAHRASVENLIETAKQLCPERVIVPAKETVERLKRRQNTTRARLEEVERLHGTSIEVVAQEMQRHRALYLKSKKDLDDDKNLIKQLKLALSERRESWDKFLKNISIRAKEHFLMNLTQRGYTGQLEFDHIAKTLLPRVNTNTSLSAVLAAERAIHETDEADAHASHASRGHRRGKHGHDHSASDDLNKDPRLLSGGEKSFSTISLLLALWDAIGCPMRCLDEFDVFMDAVNRRQSMRMIIENARKTPSTQYILITPQDMGNVMPASDIKINRLRDPERMNQAQPDLH